MNVITRLEYELAYYDSAVHSFNHYTTTTPPPPSCLRQLNTSTVSLQKIRLLQGVSGIWHKIIWWWGSSNAGGLGNAKYTLIAITSRSTLIRSCSTWKSPIYGLKRTKHHHHHHVMPLARISLTLSRHFSLSFIASHWSSGLHPVCSHSCWMYVWAGRPAFGWPYAGIHRRTSHMSWSLHLQQCPACLVRRTWIVFVMGGRWPYSWCLVGCCRQDLFNIARKILV